MDVFKSLTFLLLSSLVSATHENDLGVHCTFPPSWQSKVFFDSGEVVMSIPEVMNGTGTYYYDYPSKQMRFDIKVTASLGNVEISNTYIWHFNESAVYTIDNDNNTCYKGKVSDYIWNPWNGVPLDAHSDWHGGIGYFQEITELFTLIRKEQYANDILTIDVKAGEVCPPIRYIIQSEYSDTAFGDITHYEFLDTQNITDHSVFNLPSFCSKTIPSKSDQRKKRKFPSKFLRLFMG
ncbi:uncharacterized protein [Argopecten irradians]|uniref:uncharacterized protein n=1 Tax=Argopecten irradians TaxID=31199 RepID=UPI00371768C9